MSFEVCYSYIKYLANPESNTGVDIDNLESVFPRLKTVEQVKEYSSSLASSGDLMNLPELFIKDLSCNDIDRINIAGLNLSANGDLSFRISCERDNPLIISSNNSQDLLIATFVPRFDGVKGFETELNNIAVVSGFNLHEYRRDIRNPLEDGIWFDRYGYTVVELYRHFLTQNNLI
jgi:hypothetical protein